MDFCGSQELFSKQKAKGHIMCFISSVLALMHHYEVFHMFVMCLGLALVSHCDNFDVRCL